MGSERTARSWKFALVAAHMSNKSQHAWVSSIKGIRWNKRSCSADLSSNCWRTKSGDNWHTKEPHSLQFNWQLRVTPPHHSCGFHQSNKSESASLEDGEQVICCHSRWTCGCTPPGCPQTREQSISIQFKGLCWFRSQNLLAQFVSGHRWASGRVCQSLKVVNITPASQH